MTPTRCTCLSGLTGTDRAAADREIGARGHFQGCPYYLPRDYWRADLDVPTASHHPSGDMRL